MESISLEIPPRSRMISIFVSASLDRIERLIVIREVSMLIYEVISATSPRSLALSRACILALRFHRRRTPLFFCSPSSSSRSRCCCYSKSSIPNSLLVVSPMTTSATTTSCWSCSHRTTPPKTPQTDTVSRAWKATLLSPRSPTAARTP